jgi:hypothetical protein
MEIFMYRKLILVILFFLLTPRIGSAINIVQTSKIAPGLGTTIVFTLTPRPGNILIAFTAYSQYGEARTISGPTGWTKIDDATESPNDSLASWWYLVPSSPPTTYTFQVTDVSAPNSNEYHSGTIFEINGADPINPINQHAILTGNNASTITSTGITPNVLGCLPLASTTRDNNAATNSLTTGWTKDQEALPSYHSCTGLSKNEVTRDLTTAISVVVGWANASDAVIDALLIAPVGTKTIQNSGIINSGKYN